MRLCHLFALAVGGFALVAATPSSADACHWWGRGGGWGSGGARYATAAPAYYAPGPAMYAPGAPMYAPGPGYYAPRAVYPAPGVQYAPPPGVQYAPSPGVQYAPAPGVRAMPAGPAGPAKAAAVAAKDNTFEPPTLNVQPGATVRWTNSGAHPHTVTDRDGTFDSGDIAPGASYTHTFQTPGTYRYYCKHHKGMEGTIVVGEPGKGPGTGPSPAKGPSY